MTANGWCQIFLFLALVLLVTKPMGIFITRVFNREKTFLDPVLGPIERLLYRVTGVDADHEMGWKEYAVSMLLFSLVSMIALYLMERLQGEFPAARLVKAFNSVGAAAMVNPQFKGGPPTMFMCGNDEDAKKTVKGILDQFGWQAEDLGGAEAARAIEPLCMLWCIPGFQKQDWVHAFKMLR